jgi:hypothetical protein
MICLTHEGQVVKGFCNSCLIPVCGVCLLMTHVQPTHEVVSLSVAGKSARVKVMEQAARVIDEANDIDSCLPTIRRGLENVRENEGKIKNIIVDSFSRMRKLLQKREAEILNELHEEAENEIGRLAAVKNEYKVIGKKMRDDVRKATLLTHEASSVEMLKQAQKMEYKLQKFIQKRPALLASKEALNCEIDFSFDPKLEKEITHFGKLSFKSASSAPKHPENSSMRFAVVAQAVGVDKGHLGGAAPSWNAEVTVTPHAQRSSAEQENIKDGNRVADKTRVDIKDPKSGKLKTFYFDQQNNLVT